MAARSWKEKTWGISLKRGHGRARTVRKYNLAPAMTAGVLAFALDGCGSGATPENSEQDPTASVPPTSPVRVQRRGSGSALMPPGRFRAERAPLQ